MFREPRPAGQVFRRKGPPHGRKACPAAVAPGTCRMAPKHDRNMTDRAPRGQGLQIILKNLQPRVSDPASKIFYIL